MQRVCPAGGQVKFLFKTKCSKGQWQKPQPKSQGSWSADGARHGGLDPESLGALETRKSSGGLLVVSVRLADGTVVNVPGVRMDLAVKFEGFDSTESFLVLDMDKYDLILGMPWPEKHEPWIDWRGKAIGASRPAVSDRALVSNVPTSVRDWGARDGRQGAYAPEEADNVVPQAGNLGPQAAEAAEEDAESVSGVGNIVPCKIKETEKIESAACVSSVGNVVPRGVKKTNTRAEVLLNTSRVDNKVPYSESETPSARPVEEQCHVFDGVSGRQVKAGAVHLETLPEAGAQSCASVSMKDFLAELKAGEIAEMVLLKPETSPEDLNSSSVMDEDVLEGFTKQRATRLGSEILKNPEDPVYHLVNEFSVVMWKHPPSQLPPDREVRHEIDLVPGTKYCVTRQWPLPREQREVVDAFFAEKAKLGMVRESKSPHSTPTFCVRKPNRKWRLVHTYNKLNNATVPAQTPIPRKDVLLNNMSGCTLYSALDLVDGYYQILMRESDIPLTAVSTPSGMLWEWLVMPQGLSNAPATFNRLVTQLFRPLRTFERTIAYTYFDDIFVHSRAEGGQTAMEVHLKHLRRVFEVMRANKLYANIDKCGFAAVEIKGLGCFVSRVGVRAGPGKVKALRLGRRRGHRRTSGSGWRQADENKWPSVKDDEGRERVIFFQSRQRKAAERKYPVHDKELLAMKYALVKFRVHLLGTRTSAW
ncbi:Pol protein [Phytophthora palmivora]|uniref:Pol protein n=1 Tax=Phytophthora palmivora TaxID=4796 RepID=A0A2P4YQK2_9STRA|nr:Pol protein [Phytophthora palmivora]